MLVFREEAALYEVRERFFVVVILLHVFKMQFHEVSSEVTQLA